MTMRCEDCSKKIDHLQGADQLWHDWSKLYWFIGFLCNQGLITGETEQDMLESLMNLKYLVGKELKTI